MTRFLCAIVVVASTACATAYGPSGFSGGYADQLLDDGTREVTFKGNSYLTRDQVIAYATRRASELCPGAPITKTETACNDLMGRAFGPPEGTQCEQYKARVVVEKCK